MITDEEFDGFRKAMKEVADKKMRKLSKKLEHWAGIYFGEPVAIIYARKGAVVETEDGERCIIEPSGGKPWGKKKDKEPTSK